MGRSSLTHKREGQLKSAFAKELQQQCPNLLILQIASAGAADRLIVGGGKATFWEMKHATPQFDSPGNQELFCMRLAAACHCRYVIWYETEEGVGKRTMIVHPRTVFARAGWQLEPEAWCPGFNHQWLVQYIRQIHGL